MPVAEVDLASYVIESNDLANAMHNDIGDGSHMVTVATRDIRKGEEIFVTYGPEYWMGQPSFGTRARTSTSSLSAGRGFG